MTQRLSAAWERAGEELGIEVVAPFDLVVGENGDSERCIAHVANFGSAQGTLVVGRGEITSRIVASAAARGLFLSMIDEGVYSVYERVCFVDTLNDWGWYGEEGREPAWYTGEPWTA